MYRYNCINICLIKLIPPGLNCINPKFSSLLAVSSENAFTQKDKVSLASCRKMSSKKTKVITNSNLHKSHYNIRKRLSMMSYWRRDIQVGQLHQNKFRFSFDYIKCSSRNQVQSTFEWIIMYSMRTKCIIVLTFLQHPTMETQEAICILVKRVKISRY